MPTWDKTADLEEGDLTDFNATSGTGLSASGAAARSGSYGFAVAITDTTVRYGQFTGPADTSMTIEWNFNLNSLTMADGDMFRTAGCLNPTASSILRAAILRTGADYILVASATEDGGGGGVTIGSYTLPSVSAWYLIRLVWKAATAPGANDGRVYFYVGGTTIGSLTSLDTDAQTIDDIKWGAVQGLDAGTSGTVYFDDMRYANECEYLGLLSGTLTTAGALTKKTKKALAGALTTSGTLSSIAQRAIRLFTNILAIIAPGVGVKSSITPATDVDAETSPDVATRVKGSVDN